MRRTCGGAERLEFIPGYIYGTILPLIGGTLTASGDS